MATKGTAVGKGELVDLSGYAGEDTSGEFFQPFWDAELYDANGEPVGQDAPVFMPNPWDRLQLGDHVLPGLWRVSGSVAIQLDVQKPQGYDGAAIITRGYIPGRFSMEGTLFGPAQWARWQEVTPAIWTRPFKVSAQDVVLGKRQGRSGVNRDDGLIVGTQKALTVVHPALNAHPIAISAVVIERVYVPRDGSIPLTKVVQFDCVEYVAEPQKKPSAQKKVAGQKTRGQGAFEKAITSRKVGGKPSEDTAALGPGELPKE